MTKLVNIALMTEFSFKQSYLHMGDIHKYVVDGMVGVADINNTYAHVHLRKEGEKHGFKPIYGVRLHVLPESSSKQRTCGTHWTFIALTDEGLQNIYKLVSRAWESFYYFPRVTREEACAIEGSDVAVIPWDDTFGPGYPGRHGAFGYALQYNNYGEVGDKSVYQIMAGARKNGEGYSHFFSDCTYAQHILTKGEWKAEGLKEHNIVLTNNLAHDANADIEAAEMVAYDGGLDMRRECMKGAMRKEVDLDDPVYHERFEYELDLIQTKGYTDYFMIVSDMIKHAKKRMLVGPSRGSSAGSLVCYLLDITEVDPVEHSLIFERFIDVNRFDLPDIDIDFPDRSREDVIKYLKHKYGSTKVRCLSNINRFKAKSAIGEFAKGLGIPPYETSAVKDAIIERSTGDARAAMCIMDTFETTEPGKQFIEQYPAMRLVEHIENHASHSGKHAAGILVATKPLTNYASINSRDDVVMLDKKDAEEMGLLKIDCLGLRTLSILEDVAEQIGMDYADYYSMPLDDPKTFELFNDLRLQGIFQFEGQALGIIVKQMGVKDFNDISAISALARPGALNSGGTARYIKYSNGDDTATYYSDVHKSITGYTNGIVVYQEQMMEIARNCGGLSWADTSDLRRAASKSMGDEFFGKYKDKFVTGAIDNGYTPEVADILWNDISSSGSWSFNKSHAVSYGMVSYWTAWAKANHPLEFAVASLNNARDSDHARKLLRDITVQDNIEYIAVDVDRSLLKWTAVDGKLIGALTNIDGIGIMKAKQIIKFRDAGWKGLTPGLFKKMENPVTPYDVIFPAAHYFGKLYNDPLSYGLKSPPIEIRDVDGIGDWVFLGKLVDRNVRDLNEHIFLTKRDGEIIEDDNLYLNMKIEDDTDMVSCRVSRWEYEDIGREVAETGRVDKDWYLIYGSIRSTDYRVIDIRNIINLNKHMGVEPV